MLPITLLRIGNKSKRLSPKHIFYLVNTDDTFWSHNNHNVAEISAHMKKGSLFVQLVVWRIVRKRRERSNQEKILNKMTRSATKLKTQTEFHCCLWTRKRNYTQMPNSCQSLSQTPHLLPLPLSLRWTKISNRNVAPIFNCGNTLVHSSFIFLHSTIFLLSSETDLLTWDTKYTEEQSLTFHYQLYDKNCFICFPTEKSMET